MITAGIDIGTNTILMVIADVHADGSFTVLRDEHAIARLGENLRTTGSIGAPAIERATTILSSFAREIEQYSVRSIRAVATSAMRDAINASTVLEIMQEALGTQIDVIDGLEEASLTFRGSNDLVDAPVVVVDIGGGSTECTHGIDERVLSSVSMDVGVVRLTESSLPHHPASAAERSAAQQVVIQTCAEPLSVLPSGCEILAVAGTPVALAALECGVSDSDQKVIQGVRLTLDVVRAWRDRLLNMSSDELNTLPGIHPRRADVLPAGAVILATIMEKLDAKDCKVSTRGLRFGVMLSAAERSST